MAEVTVAGVGLHGGERVRVTLRARPGPVALCAGDAECAVNALRVVSTSRATAVEIARGVCVGTVEHLFSAFAGMGVHEGVVIIVEGPELPLLDGGARAWCDAVAALGLTPAAPRLRVLCDESIVVGESRYSFARGDGTSGATGLRVRIDFGDARLATEAAWNGEAIDFRDRIAPARTFVIASDLAELADAGLASHVTPESAVVITPGAVLSAGPPFRADEPARHKLLDLAGDLFLYGGPPVGRVEAIRPGHAATHAAMEIAVARGIVGVR